MTGDLNLVKNPALRSVLKSGPKFREPKPIDYDQVREAVVADLDGVVQRWATKCDLDEVVFKEWRATVLEVLDERLSTLRSTASHKVEPFGLQRPDVSSALGELHKSFVLVPADKADGNVIIVCRQYYLHCMVDELSRNPECTYEEVTEEREVLLDRLCTEMKTLFDVAVPEDFRTFAYLYWTAKMHKLPPGRRFIAGGKKCESKVLSKQITACLTAVLGMHRRRCNQLRSSTGVQHMWIADNSKGIISRLESINRRGMARDVATFDFQTLYTKIPHQQLKAEMKWVVDTGFALAKHEGKSVLSLRGRSAGFVTEPRSGKAISALKLTEMINYLIDNIYVTCGDKVFRQTIGIPMGTSCAPLLANLYLFALELKWIRARLDAGEGGVMARLFAHCFRYIDDLLILNNAGEFKGRYKEIYPEALVLKKENEFDYCASFLDLMIKVNGGRFCRTLYDKRDAFPFEVARFQDVSGNIHVRKAHGVVVGQLIRYALGCDHAAVFFRRSAAMMTTLLRMGYRRRLLAAYCDLFFERYIHLVTKYRTSKCDFNRRCFGGRRP